MFATWVFLREANPEVVIESGIWKGQSTWLIEQATTADIVSLDLDFGNREYVSPRATYSDIDFAFMDCSALPKDKTVLFFDDHVNQFQRLMQGRAWGFTNFIFEDNYPPDLGDTPSLKQMQLGAYDGLGPDRLSKGRGFKQQIKRLLYPRIAKWDLLAHRYDPAALRHALGAIDLEYEEFPPLKTFPTTRWGTEWRATYGDLPACLDVDALGAEERALVVAEGRDYTSICNLRAPGTA